MMGMFWGLRQQQAIGEAAATAQRGAAYAADAKAGMKQLEERLDKLTLACMALWEIVKETSNLTDEDLMERVRLLDLTDGKEDGKATRGVTTCPSCNRTMSSRHTRCMYCGATRPNAGPFEKTL